MEILNVLESIFAIVGVVAVAAGIIYTAVRQSLKALIPVAQLTKTTKDDELITKILGTLDVVALQSNKILYLLERVGRIDLNQDGIVGDPSSGGDDNPSTPKSITAMPPQKKQMEGKAK
ncbi:MAG: hypothetical protein AAF599_05370 [Bacteroidota bacterium]